ncbi:MAG: bacterio-opsin activator [Candidatus Hydrothermia bacterium]|jgi:probable regulatory domain-containing protein
MKIIEPSEIQEKDVDAIAVRVFLKALEILGGPRKLVEYRNLTWLPSLMVASYAVVLSNESYKTADEIAQFLGSTKNTIRNMLKAETEILKEKLKGEVEVPKSKIKTHTAGALAKLAYEEIKNGRENLEIFSHYLKEFSEIYEINWPIEVLRNIKGLDFPIKKEVLIEKLKYIKIENKSFSEIYDKLPSEIKNPSHLLKSIKESLSL